MDDILLICFDIKFIIKSIYAYEEMKTIQKIER